MIHEVHCQRNIVLCEQCDEPVPRVDLEAHVKDVHAPVNCELCGLAVERSRVDHHKVSCCNANDTRIRNRYRKSVTENWYHLSDRTEFFFVPDET